MENMKQAQSNGLGRQTQSAVPVARRGAVVKALGLFELFEDIVQIAGARVLRRKESVDRENDTNEENGSGEDLGKTWGMSTQRGD